MKTTRDYVLAGAAGFVLTAVALVGVATLFVPEESRSPYFWQRVLWAEFLALLWWGGLTGFLFPSSRKSKLGARGFAGISPALFIVISGYVLISFVAMLVHASVGESDFSNRLHMILQICGGAGLGILAVFFMITKAAATEQAVFDESSCAKPLALCDLLAMHESRLASLSSVDQSQSLRKAIKRIREAIKASLHESTACSESADYQSFASDIESFCRTLPNPSQSAESLEAKHLDSILIAANDLHARVRLVASRLIRR